MQLDSSHAASIVLSQILARQQVTDGFERVFADYQRALQNCTVFQVRNQQLDKEARELREENTALHESHNDMRRSSASRQQLDAAEAKAKEASEELTRTLKEKDQRTTECMKAREHLDKVRVSNERQTRELEAAGKEIKELKQRIKGLIDQAEASRKAHDLATGELQKRLEEKEAALAETTRLKREHDELAQRLVDMQMEMVERKHAMEKEKHELQVARQQAAQMSAQLGGTPAISRTSSSVRRTSTSDSSGLARAGTSDTGSLPHTCARAVQAHAGGAFGLTFDRTGSRLASGGTDKKVRLWDASTGAETTCLHGNIDTINDVAFSCVSTHLVAAGSDSALQVFDVGTGRSRHIMRNHQARVTSVDCHPTDATKAVSGSMDRDAKVWDIERGRVITALPSPSIINTVAFLKDAGVVVSGHQNGTLRFIDTRAKKSNVHEIAGLHTQGGVCGLAVGSHAGLLVTCGRDNRLQLIDPRTYQVQRSLNDPRFTVDSTWCSPCLSSDDLYAVSGSGSGSIFIWQVSTGNMVRELQDAGSSRDVQATAWSPQGNTLVSCDKAGMLRFWPTTS